MLISKYIWGIRRARGLKKVKKRIAKEAFNKKCLLCSNVDLVFEKDWVDAIYGVCYYTAVKRGLG